MRDWQNEQMDMNRELMLDGNAAGGVLHEIFAAEVTAAPAQCAHCGHVAEIGALLAFTQAPGIVLRCPTCEGVMMRIVRTNDAIYLEAQGVAYLRLERRTP